MLLDRWWTKLELNWLPAARFSVKELRKAACTLKLLRLSTLFQDFFLKACIFNANLILLEMKNEHFIIRVRSAQCDDDY